VDEREYQLYEDTLLEALSPPQTFVVGLISQPCNRGYADSQAAAVPIIRPVLQRLVDEGLMRIVDTQSDRDLSLDELDARIAAAADPLDWWYSAHVVFSSDARLRARSIPRMMSLGLWSSSRTQGLSKFINLVLDDPVEKGWATVTLRRNDGELREDEVGFISFGSVDTFHTDVSRLLDGGGESAAIELGHRVLTVAKGMRGFVATVGGDCRLPVRADSVRSLNDSLVDTLQLHELWFPR
jgi:hypothetical protein